MGTYADLGFGIMSEMELLVANSQNIEAYPGIFQYSCKHL